MKLKSAGKADTQHHEPIPQESEDAMFDLIAKLQAIMSVEDKKTQKYKDLVAKLPLEDRNNYHFLIQYSAGYLFMSMFARRGSQGIDELTKSHFEVVVDKENNLKFWQKVRGELSKNNR